MKLLVFMENNIAQFEAPYLTVNKHNGVLVVHGSEGEYDLTKNLMGKESKEYTNLQILGKFNNYNGYSIDHPDITND